MKLFNCKTYNSKIDLIGIIDFDSMDIEDTNKYNTIEFMKLKPRVKFEFRAMFGTIEKNDYLTLRASDGKKVIINLAKTHKTKKGFNARVNYIKICESENIIFEYDRFKFILRKNNQDIFLDSLYKMID